MSTERRFAELACHQALDAHETECVSFHDALHTAERMYSLNWATYRKQRGFWGPRDEERAKNHALPSGAARKVFDSDDDIQRILASRDARLPVFRDKLQAILGAHASRATAPSFEPVLREFLDFGHDQSPGAYPWRVTLGDIRCVFPGRATWAIWLCLRDMWPSQNK